MLAKAYLWLLYLYVWIDVALFATSQRIEGAFKAPTTYQLEN